jgi:hypothetical protein
MTCVLGPLGTAYFPRQLIRRSTLTMTLTLQALRRLVITVVPLAGILSSCSQADNPKIAEAPPPPPPKPEQQVSERAGKKVDFGANPKYKAMMEKQEKYFENP